MWFFATNPWMDCGLDIDTPALIATLPRRSWMGAWLEIASLVAVADTTLTFLPCCSSYVHACRYLLVIRSTITTGTAVRINYNDIEWLLVDPNEMVYQQVRLVTFGIIGIGAFGLLLDIVLFCVWKKWTRQRKQSRKKALGLVHDFSSIALAVQPGATGTASLTNTNTNTKAVDSNNNYSNNKRGARQQQQQHKAVTEEFDAIPVEQAHRRVKSQRRRPTVSL